MNLIYELISLRPFEISDAEAHLEGEDEEQIKWLSGGKGTLEGTQNWIKKNQEYWENNGPVFTFAIIEASTDQLVGMVEANANFEKLEQIQEGEVNISYGLYPTARGKGYASQAVTLMMEFLKNKGYDRVVIAVDPENTNSLKLPERLGFQKTEEITIKKNEHHILFKKAL